MRRFLEGPHAIEALVALACLAAIAALGLAGQWMTALVLLVAGLVTLVWVSL